MSGFISRLSQRVMAPEALPRPRATALFDPEAVFGAQPGSPTEEEGVGLELRGPRISSRPVATRHIDARGVAERTGLPAVVPALAGKPARNDAQAAAAVDRKAVEPLARAIAAVTTAVERIKTVPGAIEPGVRAPTAEADSRFAEVDEATDTQEPVPIENRAEEQPAAPMPPDGRAESGTEAATGQRPVIRVTIGRVEVRAPAPANRAEAKPAQPRARTSITLDDYLGRTRHGKS